MIHTGSESKEKSDKNQTKLSKNQMKLRMIHIWSNRGRTVSISQNLVVMPKNIQAQRSKTTFKQSLTCIFQSVRLNSKETFQCETPCMYCYLMNALIRLSADCTCLQEAILAFMQPHSWAHSGTKSFLSLYQNSNNHIARVGLCGFCTRSVKSA